ncbi:MAG: nickel-dependent lactate racemase [Firmicutes bacterium]|nr:nickel-dependent lactate racemase [Bacillota bacterium]
MKTIEIPYGHGVQTLHIDPARLNAVLEPPAGAASPESSGEESRIVTEALAAPIGTVPLAELSAGKRRILVITSDHTRPMPSRVTMPLLLNEIRQGNPQAEITILIATGMHRPTTAEEIRARFGEEMAAAEQIVVHNAYHPEELAYFGTLPSGGELWLNGLLKQADLIVAEGFIEPHFFAGFSGGRKSILPGVAGERTVMYNHNAKFIADPRARQGNLAGNPLHRDMLYAAQAAGLAFILNVLLDDEKKIKAAFAGDPEAAHAGGCALCEKRLRVAPVRSDIVITSNGGYPLDQNLYQSVKGMTAGEACVREGGIIIMVAEARDGHGGESFYRWFAERGGAGQVLRDIEGVPAEETHADQWEAQILARILKKASCIFVTAEANRALIEAMHMNWAESVDAALAQAYQELGPDSSVTVIPNGVGVIL